MKQGVIRNIFNWVDERFPVSEFWRQHVSHYYAPKNLNFWYMFGAFSLVVLVLQIVTGIWLAMVYTPTASGAFASVETIMRDVNFGWLLRYIHTTGASAFFLVVYLHMYRAIMYGSYRKPRELLWLFGMVVYVLLLMEAFTGYVLPWGQMSYWASQVITSLFDAVPVIGKDLTIWLRGDFNVSGVTLHRCFSLHVIAIPLVLLAMVGCHLIALHTVGSNNPDGVEIKDNKDEKGIPKDGVPFHPYYTVKDLFGILVFLTVFFIIVFFYPKFGGFFLEPENYLPANPLVTPEHIVPVWYMTPFYAILRAIPHKLGGSVVMAAAVAILFVLPWLDRSPVKSIRYKGAWSKFFLVMFVISFIALGYFGIVPVTPLRVWLTRLFTLFYFAFFILMPFYTKYEKTATPPTRLTE